MAIIVGNKTYRNLQEQVKYLSERIGDATDVVKKIVGKVASTDNLPAATSVSIGDTYAVGASSPYSYYVSDGTNWIGLGTFPLKGDDGADGEDGNSIWMSSDNTATSSTNAIDMSTIYNPETLAINAGNIIIANGLAFVITGFPDPPTGYCNVQYRYTFSAIQGPKGDKGDKGDTGATGATGAAAGFGTPTTSATTLSEGASATATISTGGPDTEKIFNFAFGIPKGATGQTGTPAGFDTPTATATTGAAGSSATASVSASGPDTYKKFDFAFGIPKGDTGVGFDTIETEQFPYGTPVVTYDEDDGIGITATHRYSSDGTNYDFTADEYIPIFPGSGITIDANADNDGVEIAIDETSGPVHQLKEDLVTIGNSANTSIDSACVDVYEMWELGTLENDGTPLASTIRIRTNDYIPCYGTKLKTQYFDDKWAIEYYFYDANQAFISESQYITTEYFDIPYQAKYIKIIAKHIPDIVFTDNVPNSIPVKFSFTDISNINLYASNLGNIRVTTFNVRWYVGDETIPDSYAPLTAEQVATILPKFKNVLADTKPDVLICCEDYRAYFDEEINGSGGAKTMNVYSMLYEHYFPYKYDGGRSIGSPVIYSKYPILNSGMIDVTYGEGISDYRKPIYAKININGTIVYVVGTHPISGANDYIGDRQNYNGAIVTAMGSHNNVIVAGDFNTDSSHDELSVFTSNHYTVGNKGYFGDIETYYGGGVKVLDNIAVKGFIINNFDTNNEHCSDHKPCSSELNFKL